MGRLVASLNHPGKRLISSRYFSQRLSLRDLKPFTPSVSPVWACADTGPKDGKATSVRERPDESCWANLPVELSGHGAGAYAYEPDRTLGGGQAVTLHLRFLRSQECETSVYQKR